MFDMKFGKTPSGGRSLWAMGTAALCLAGVTVATIRHYHITSQRTLRVRTINASAESAEVLNAVGAVQRQVAAINKEVSAARLDVNQTKSEFVTLRQDVAELKSIRKLAAPGPETSGKDAQRRSMAWSPPAGSVKASVRPLPYPFTRYFSIASDVDSMSFKAAGEIYNSLANFHLSIADSTHVDAGLGGPAAQAIDANNLAATTTVDILSGNDVLENRLARWLSEGLIDTHHGLYSGFFIKSVDLKPTLISSGVAGKAAVPAQFPMVRYFKGASPSGGAIAPPELVLRYEMPFPGSVTVRVIDDAGAVIWAGQPRALPARILPTAIAFAMDGLNLELLAKTEKPVVEIGYVSGFAQGALKVDALGILDRSRARVEAGFKKAKALNLTLPVFSRHTMPPGGTIGISDLTALPDTTAWALSFAGDNPASPSYWIDLSDDHGTEFIGRDTSTIDKAFPITDLSFPYLFYDGKRRYSFHRAFSSLRLDAMSSLEPALGDQVAGTLKTIDAAPAGSGGLLYTHWGIPLAPQRFQEVGGVWPLSKPSLDAFNILAGRHYGILDGKAVPEADRLWISSVYRQLVYSVVRRQIEPNIFYVANDNTVRIKQWRDDVTERLIPSLDQPSKRLQGITVYVENASTARAFVEDKELFSFTRNAADQSGKQSITFVDNSTPTLIFDEIDLVRRPGRLVQRNARVFPTMDAPYAGSRAMDVVTQSANGMVEWQPERLSCVRTDAFQFAVRKNAASVKVSVVLTDDKDATWEFSETGREATTIGLTAGFPSADVGKWALHTFAFAHLNHASIGKPSVPWGKLKSVRFLVSGEDGQSATFDRVGCLRENPLDDPSQGFRISGRIAFDGVEPAPTPVSMETGGKRYTTISSVTGVYAFDERVPRDALVMVSAVGGPNKDAHFPDQGRIVQVTNNIADLDITLPKDQRPPDLNGSVPATQLGTGSFVADAGFHYRPGSRFSSTGLAKPTEYLSDMITNNLGYIDRDHRVPRINERALRILILGVCNLWGHTEGLYHNPATVMETMLEQRLQRTVEVMNMSSATQHAGLSWFFYDKLGKAYKPDIIFYELVGPLDVGLSLPRYARIYHMTKDTNLPSSTFRPDDKGVLRPQFADPNYPNFKITDPAVIERRNKELAQNAYIIDGVNFPYLFHRDPAKAFNEKEKEVEAYYGQLVKEVKRRFDGDGVRVVFLVTDHFGQAYVPPLVDGVAHARKHFDARMEKICADAGAECLHFVPFMEKRFPTVTNAHWRRDSHYSRIGYRWFVEAMVEHLEKRP
jgi:hypothetical protein